MVKGSDVSGGSQATRPPGPLGGQTILIAEDEVIIAMELAAIMEEGGAIVAGPAHTLKLALEIAEREELSAAVLDVRLGRDSIKPVAEALAKRRVPFAFYSGQMPGDDLQAQWPQVPFVAKPAKPRQIVDAVARLVGGATSAVHKD